MERRLETQAAVMTSRSLHKTRHDGEHYEQQIIGCSRHRVSRGEKLLDRETPNPKHEPELRVVRAVLRENGSAGARARELMAGC
jgi:hypothetical protein